jgi:hypothetical protein
VNGLPYIAAMKTLRIVTAGFRWENAYAAVSRRPPISLDTIVARTEGNAYAAKVWDLSIVQGPFSVAPCQIRSMLRFATFFVAVRHQLPLIILENSNGLRR